MYLVTGEEMVRLDQAAIHRLGIPSLVLMENAGIKVTQAVVNRLAEQGGKKVVIVAGKGNNGGDGFVAARQLAAKGYEVKVFLLGRVEDVKGDARINLDILRRLKIPLLTISDERDLNKLRIALFYADVIVDAIFGTGFKGAVLGLGDKLITLVNNSGVKVIAVDIPSGLEANTGRVYGNCIRADETVTFAFPKVGLFMNQAIDYAGLVTVADISIPASLALEENIQRWIITEDDAKKLIPRRHKNSHKGTYGHAFIVSGSTGMTGAACLSCEGVLIAGAGLVTLGIPASLNSIMEQKLTEVMTKPLPETIEGTLSTAAFQALITTLEQMSVLIMGPGLSQNKETKELVCRLLEEVKIPLVLDADGLNALVGKPGLLAKLKGPCVITPHPGELSRLLDLPVEKIQQNRLNTAVEAAKKLNVTIVLKGNNTVIANPAGQAWVNLTGNPGMATGGTGDVLAGLIGGFICQGLKIDEAAILGVYLHGLAGDDAVQAKGMLSLKASDLLAYLPPAIKKLELK
jgi:NAD(P)H-hydrate epimerase